MTKPLRLAPSDRLVAKGSRRRRITMKPTNSRTLFNSHSKIFSRFGMLACCFCLPSVSALSTRLELSWSLTKADRQCRAASPSSSSFGNQRPPGPAFDSSTSTSDANYRTVIPRFFTDVAPSAYFNILTQYYGECESNSSNSCVVPNASGTVTLGGTISDPSTPTPMLAPLPIPCKTPTFRPKYRWPSKQRLAQWWHQRRVFRVYYGGYPGMFRPRRGLYIRIPKGPGILRLSQ